LSKEGAIMKTDIVIGGVSASSFDNLIQLFSVAKQGYKTLRLRFNNYCTYLQGFTIDTWLDTDKNRGIIAESMIRDMNEFSSSTSPHFIEALEGYRKNELGFIEDIELLADIIDASQDVYQEVNKIVHKINKNENPIHIKEDIYLIVRVLDCCIKIQERLIKQMQIILDNMIFAYYKSKVS